MAIGACGAIFGSLIAFPLPLLSQFARPRERPSRPSPSPIEPCAIGLPRRHSAAPPACVAQRGIRLHLPFRSLSLLRPPRRFPDGSPADPINRAAAQGTPCLPL